jgi:1-acyl-sn-glycerol-3-phosphate acyltransferase
MPRKPLADPPGLTRRLKALSKAIPAASALSSSLLVINTAQLASLAVRPLSRRAFRAFNRQAADSWWGWCVELAERLHGTHLVLSGDPIPAGESALVVINHQQMADITFMMQFARSKGRLGDMRWFVKDVLKWVPGVGWGLWMMGAFMVKRDWNADRASIERTFAGIRRDKVPVWVLLFVEGHRIRPDRVAESQAFARERGLPVLEHVLVPRTKGFTATVQGLREHVDAVYDITIGYQEGVPSLWQYIQGFATEAHLHTRRYPIADLPEGEEQLGAWLMQRFQEKDRLLAGFYETGAFPIGHG